MPTMGERILDWLGRVPRAVSRPGAALFGLRDGDSDAGGSGGGTPLGSSRRSIELLRGSGGLDGGVALREEPHATDDLEAAVETIENAKAKVGGRAAWEGRGGMLEARQCSPLS